MESLHTPGPAESRLRGSLVARNAQKIGRGSLAGSVSVEKPLHQSAEKYLKGLQGTIKGVSEVFEGRATLVRGARVSGAWHYSRSAIDRFTSDRAERSAGKFGKGTYLGVGSLQGETITGLIESGSVRHEVSLRDSNLLVLDRNNVRSIATDLKRWQGLSVSKIGMTIDNGPLSELVADMDIEGLRVDGVMVYMDPDQQSAEIVMLPRATEQLAITDGR